MNRKGVNLFKSWAEAFALVLLVVGFIVSLFAGSKLMSYLIVTLCGMIFGRLWYRTRHSFKFPWFLIILGFLVGYILGNIYGNLFTLMFLFVFGIIVSYQLHKSKMIKSVEY